VELYKCFLVGTYKRKKLIVMPSACLVTEGSDILKEEVLSPYLQQDLSSFEVYVLADKIYPFGRLRNLKYHG
ncbi:phosphoesterase, partial [Candidatus Woesearchaeota archaeon]|nr:phosphoesterase [Candidatus Woesearchaeota archaeon]